MAPGKEKPVPVVMRLVRPQSFCGRFGEEDYFFPCRDSNSGLSSLYHGRCTDYSFLALIYRVSQEEKSRFWEVIVSVIVRKKCM
jgi:hypothetical protein